MRNLPPTTIREPASRHHPTHVMIVMATANQRAGKMKTELVLFLIAVETMSVSRALDVTGSDRLLQDTSTSQEDTSSTTSTFSSSSEETSTTTSSTTTSPDRPTKTPDQLPQQPQPQPTLIPSSTPLTPTESPPQPSLAQQQISLQAPRPSDIALGSQTTQIEDPRQRDAPSLSLSLLLNSSSKGQSPTTTLAQDNQASTLSFLLSRSTKNAGQPSTNTLSDSTFPSSVPHLPQGSAASIGAPHSTHSGSKLPLAIQIGLPLALAVAFFILVWVFRRNCCCRRRNGSDSDSLLRQKDLSDYHNQFFPQPQTDWKKDVESDASSDTSHDTMTKLEGNSSAYLTSFPDTTRTSTTADRYNNWISDSTVGALANDLQSIASNTNSRTTLGQHPASTFAYSSSVNHSAAANVDAQTYAPSSVVPNSSYQTPSSFHMPSSHNSVMPSSIIDNGRRATRKMSAAVRFAPSAKGSSVSRYPTTAYSESQRASTLAPPSTHWDGDTSVYSQATNDPGNRAVGALLQNRLANSGY